MEPEKSKSEPNLYSKFLFLYYRNNVCISGFHPEENVSEIGLFTKIGNFKTDPKQISETIKRALKFKIKM